MIRSALVLAVALVAGPLSVSAQAAPPAPPAPATPPSEPGTPSAPVPTYQEVMALGRATAQHALAGRVDSLLVSADPSAGTSEALRPRLSAGLAQIDEQMGVETALIREQVVRVNGGLQYWRTAEYSNVPVPLVFRVVMGVPGKWRGFTASVEDALPAFEEVTP